MHWINNIISTQNKVPCSPRNILYQLNVLHFCLGNSTNTRFFIEFPNTEHSKTAEVMQRGEGGGICVC